MSASANSQGVAHRLSTVVLFGRHGSETWPGTGAYGFQMSNESILSGYSTIADPVKPLDVSTVLEWACVLADHLMPPRLRPKVLGETVLLS